MTSVTLANAKAHLGALVQRASQRESVCITRHGKAVAQITSPEKARKRIDLVALQALTATLPPHDGDGDGGMREARDEERY